MSLQWFKKKRKKKLRSIRLDGNVLKWLYNFLRERSQKVISGGKSSNAIPSSKGLPQGRVLGPLPFNIYVADLAKLQTSFKRHCPRSLMI